MKSMSGVPKSTLTAELVKRKVGKARGAMKLTTKEPKLLPTTRQHSLLKSVFSGYN